MFTNDSRSDLDLAWSARELVLGPRPSWAVDRPLTEEERARIRVGAPSPWMSLFYVPGLILAFQGWRAGGAVLQVVAIAAGWILFWSIPVHVLPLRQGLKTLRAIDEDPVAHPAVVAATTRRAGKARVARLMVLSETAGDDFVVATVTSVLGRRHLGTTEWCWTAGDLSHRGSFALLFPGGDVIVAAKARSLDLYGTAGTSPAAPSVAPPEPVAAELTDTPTDAPAAALRAAPPSRYARLIGDPSRIGGAGSSSAWRFVGPALLGLLLLARLFAACADLQPDASPEIEVPSAAPPSTLSTEEALTLVPRELSPPAGASVTFVSSQGDSEFADVLVIYQMPEEDAPSIEELAEAARTAGFWVTATYPSTFTGVRSDGRQVNVDRAPADINVGPTTGPGTPEIKVTILLTGP